MNAASRERSTAVARIAIELLLATFALWLVVQNTLLLALDPWAARPPALVVIAAVLKALWHVTSAAWPLVLFAAITGGAIAVALTVRLAARRGGVA